MPKGNNNNNNSPSPPKGIAELKRQVELMEARITVLESSNKSLEGKVESLESRVKISERVSDQLSLDLDRLDQYHRRSNIIIRDVFVPEKETLEDVKKNVHNIITKDLGLPKMVSKIDKLHRVGIIKEKDGKKMQNVIVRFKSHFARYAVYNERKKAKNIKISTNLTKRRGKLLFDVSNAVKEVGNVQFCFANINGDLKIRLVEPYNGKQVFSFNSLNELNSLLLKMGLIEESIVLD